MIFLLLFFNFAHASLIEFNPGDSVDSQKINQNYQYIKDEVDGYPIELNFQNFNSNEVITTDKLNSNANLILNLNSLSTIPTINHTQIKSMDLNNQFNLFLQEIQNNWKISDCDGIQNSSRFNGDGYYWMDLDGDGVNPPVQVFCSFSRKTKEYFSLNDNGNFKTLNTGSDTEYLVSFARHATSSVSSLEFSGDHNLKHGDTEILTQLVEYPAGTYGTMNYCDATADSKMCMVRFSGNVILNGTHMPTTRKKGFVIYVDGDLTLNGTISMTARGAIAAGQNLNLIKGYSVPAVGGAGGIGVLDNGLATGNAHWNSLQGGDGTNGASGGGAAGNSTRYSSNSARGGNGAAGTSYSGGGGGGGATARSCNTVGGNAEANGGAGGSAHGCWDWNVRGGAGNPGGVKKTNNAYEYIGTSGTGGLLIVYVNGNIILNSSAVISSDGTASTGGTGTDGNGIRPGGASGAGSVNVFYSGTNSGSGIIRANGQMSSVRRSGNGTARAIQVSF